jgi:hypothetical protein
VDRLSPKPSDKPKMARDMSDDEWRANRAALIARR